MTLEEYIRASAQQRGINPDIAVKVAMAEGGLKDPTRQSLVTKNGVREPSYGPFQLLVGGGSTGFPEGLGNQALAQGIDPRRPEDAYRAIDFALDTASKKGWGQWYGAKAAGLDNFAGIGGRPATSVAQSTPPASPSPVFGAVPTPRPEVAAAPIPDAVQKAAEKRQADKSMSDVFGMLAMAQAQGPQFSPVQIMGPSAEQAGGLSQLVQALRSRII